ncbi:MAG: hypothetical protein M3Y53_11010 [Thermoproteota archaeon]|nr:hypothetical protein [Thermoproteota archaeon]
MNSKTCFMLFFFSLQNVYQISAFTRADIQGIDVKFEFHPAMSFGGLRRRLNISTIAILTQG